jgi:PTS system ascorbate-specific IIA component
MTTSILIIAHAPLASALQACVLHVFPDAADAVIAMDVQADMPTNAVLTAARQHLENIVTDQVLVLTDVFGATPCNIAQKVVDGVRSKLVAGVNVPMLLRTVNYRHEPLDVLVTRAITGGTQCIMQVAVTAPQNQNRKNHDQKQYDHHQ